MMATDSAPSFQDDDVIDLTELAGRLWDHRWFIVSLTLLVFAAACAYAFTATRIYRANALLQIEPRSGAIPGIDQLSDLLVGNDSLAQAEIQIIRSRLVLKRTVDQLLMDVHVRPQQPWLKTHFWPERQGKEPVLFAGWHDAGRRMEISRLELPQELLGKPLRLQVLDQGLFELATDEKTWLSEGTPGKLLQTTEGVLVRIDSLQAPAGTTFHIIKQPLQKTLQSINQKLSVSEQGKNTNMLSLNYTDALPERAVAVLDAISQNYLLQNIERSSAQAEKSLDFVNSQLPVIKDQLNTAEDKLNAYRKESSSVDVSLQTRALMEQLAGVDAQINELKLKESEVASYFTTAHPTYKSLLRQRAALQQDKHDLELQIQKLPQKQQDVLRLLRDVESNKQTYETLLIKAQELKIASASTVGNVRIIDDAIAEFGPIKPKRSLIAAVGLMLGFMLAIGYVLLRMALRKGLESPDQLEQLGLSVYATIPLSTGQRRADVMSRPRRGRRHRNAPYLLASADPGDPAIEALRSLRTSLHFAMLESSNRIMLSSATPGAGKSFVAANLAAVLASSGQRVLLVETDMRRGRVGRALGLERHAAGLSHYLSEQQELQACIHATSIDGLDLIPAGKAPPNPSELLMLPRMAELAEQLSHQYDLVLFDTPPILAVTDAAIVGQLAGASLLIVRYDVNTARELAAAVQRFEKSNVALKGCIFNAIERQSSNYYYYDYQYRSHAHNAPA